MIIRTPLATLIETRMQQLGLDRPALGLRLGYRNPAKAAGRVYALCDGHITSTKSKIALHRLPEAIEVPAQVVETAVNATLSFLAELKRDVRYHPKTGHASCVDAGFRWRQVNIDRHIHGWQILIG